MKKRIKPPAYSAKPGQVAQSKEYGKQTTGWIENTLTGVKERTTVEDVGGGRHNVTMEMEFKIFLPPVEQQQGVLKYNGRGSGKTRRHG